MLSRFIREDGPLFLSTMCILVEIANLPMIIDNLKGIAQYLPTTYMNYVNVVSGATASEYNNVNITLSMGILVPSLFILLQFLLLLVRKKAK